MTTQGGQEWQRWPRREQHTRESDNVTAVSDMTSPSQGRGGGGWGRAGGVDMEAPVVTSANEPMHDMTVPTGMFQATMGHELHQMQRQTACQSTGQDVRLQIDLDTLGQDDFDLAGSAPAWHQLDTNVHTMGQRPAGDKMPAPASQGQADPTLAEGNAAVGEVPGQLSTPAQGPGHAPRRKKKVFRSNAQRRSQ